MQSICTPCPIQVPKHVSTTVGLSRHKSLPIYNHVKASRFVSDVVYTNTMTAGAYRGYGATQGQFAVESAVNELADTLHIDPCELRLKNMVQEDEVMKQYYGEHLNSCALDRCLRKAMDMIGWKEKALCRDMGDKVRGLGVALSMQGSGIANVDIASTVIKLQDDGFYTLSIGATDMGTGCDTILAQMAAECLDCDVDNIITQSVDTDASPYDTGSYASATTYVTGMAVVKTCEELKKHRFCMRRQSFWTWKRSISHLMEVCFVQWRMTKKSHWQSLRTAVLRAARVRV